MKIRRLVLVAAFLLLGAMAQAQTPTLIDPATATYVFNSDDHASPDMQAYQVLLIDAAANPLTGPVITPGAVVPKAQVEVVPQAPPAKTDYRLPFTKLGLTIPPCLGKQSSCATYVLVMLALDTNNRATPRGEITNPFQFRSTAVQVVGPTNGRVK
jgi:hypothetical protein